MNLHITDIQKTEDGWEYSTDILGDDCNVLDENGNLLFRIAGDLCTATSFEIETDSPTPPLVCVYIAYDLITNPPDVSPVFANNALILQWISVPNVEVYAIEKYDESEGEWIVYGTQSGGGLYYQYKIFRDTFVDVEQSWRVSPAIASGLDVIITGEPVELTVIRVLIPDPPKFKLTYTGGTLTAEDSTLSEETGIIDGQL